MARRPVFSEQRSALAAWSGRLSVFALVVALFSAVIVRTGLLEVGPALATFAAALVCAALAMLLALSSAIPIWRHGRTGIGRAVLGFSLGAALLAYPGYLAWRSFGLPAINDVTTNPADPPRFSVLARLRPRGTSDYPGETAAALQRAAYPDIEPLQVQVSPQLAYTTALAVVGKRKWRVVDTLAPSSTRRNGTIEAIAQTTIMGFRDDVAIRISPLGRGAQIDVRSASRYGKHDLGANAARIVALLDELDEAIDSASAAPAGPARPQRTPQQPRR